jgi:hypothetical protein
VADTCDGGFGDETEDFLRSSEESLQQGSPVCFAAFLWIHHVNKLSLLLFFTQRLDLLKAVDELLFSVSDHLL